ncbi:folate-binding protein YgfZ [Oceanicola sp. 502str15]|uniref:CAF17-like 4Fe-4S cluster assembly/insertion protein YgfZ n=1 Tax=Oceanicola sp. 502str15 TaxID=2696061 RepID=UPI00209598FF|nr:folate-binding protein [Oceanicola sp. 502str15]MCO6382997.1 folate-binding protein [Oceanicola sp. 502str15]
MERTVFRITGAERIGFLQNLVTNDLKGLERGLVWAALLTPQGKYLADFFLVPEEEALLLDVATPLAADLAKRLKMYRLRADVAVEETDLRVSRGTGPAPEGALPDPRHPAMGWRAYNGAPGDDTEWDALRVAHAVPETGVELVPGESYPLEVGFERLHGVDFRKGCYVGQEVTARMKHKTELKKGLVRVQIEGAAPVGTEIRAGEKVAGVIYTQAGGEALAWLRFDRASGPLQAGDATLTWDGSAP